MSSPDRTLHQFPVGEVAMGELFGSIIARPGHLMYRGGDLDTLQNQLPILDYRYSSRVAYRRQIRAILTAEGQGRERYLDVFGRELNRPATVEVRETQLPSGLVLPYLKLLAEPDFIDLETMGLLSEFEIGERDEILLNNSLWSWMTSEVVVAITDATHPLVVKHFEGDNPEPFFTVATNQMEIPLLDEINEVWARHPEIAFAPPLK